MFSYTNWLEYVKCYYEKWGVYELIESLYEIIRRIMACAPTASAAQ